MKGLGGVARFRISGKSRSGTLYLVAPLNAKVHPEFVTLTYHRVWMTIPRVEIGPRHLRQMAALRLP